mmetsp:Transcript_20901/g.52600  ORF Transcript_20901/g.52600 Transcript_20901/m.52600 type:complete len:232 (+) Transcript_20901:469-1164(+)
MPDARDDAAVLRELRLPRRHQRRAHARCRRALEEAPGDGAAARAGHRRRPQRLAVLLHRGLRRLEQCACWIPFRHHSVGDARALVRAVLHLLLGPCAEEHRPPRRGRVRGLRGTRRVAPRTAWLRADQRGRAHGLRGLLPGVPALLPRPCGHVRHAPERGAQLPRVRRRHAGARVEARGHPTRLGGPCLLLEGGAEDVQGGGGQVRLRGVRGGHADCRQQRPGRGCALQLE